MNVEKIHQLIQTAIVKEHVVLGNNNRDLGRDDHTYFGYGEDGAENRCLIGALLAGLYGLQGAIAQQRKPFFERSLTLAKVLDCSQLDIWLLEQGFENWSKSSAPAKLGLELYNTYV